VRPGEARIDIPTGHIPDYRTFVRHVWSYQDEDAGQSVFDPPWMYECHFKNDEEWDTIMAVCDAMIRADTLHERPLLVGDRIDLKGGSAMWQQIRFSDLEALHVFLLHLASFTAGDDPVAQQVGEFVLWTLGFRWV